jgi:hypothetical protein
MGSPQGEADRIFHGFELDYSRSFGEGWNESQVDVRLTNRFEIGRTVVTQAQWRAVMGTEPWSDESQCGDQFPAVHVSWDDAVLFCQTLTALERETGQLTATQSAKNQTGGGFLTCTGMSMSGAQIGIQMSWQAAIIRLDQPRVPSV